MLDPATITLIVGALATWAWDKARGKKTADLSDTLEALVKQEVAKLVADPTLHAKAREYLTLALHAGIERVGIKPSKMVDFAVGIAVEKALGELADKLAAYVLPSQLAKVADAAESVAGKFTPKGELGVLGGGAISFERVDELPAKEPTP